MSELERIHNMLVALKREQAYLSKRADTIKKLISDHERQILEILENLGVDMVRIDGRVYYLSEDAVYQVEDWEALYGWIVENRAPMILHRRVSKRALDELLDAGDLPDGVKPVTIKTLKSRVA